MKRTFGMNLNIQAISVITCHKLRKKQLNNFDIEDLRIMIGQNIGLIFFFFFLKKLNLKNKKKNFCKK